MYDLKKIAIFLAFIKLPYTAEPVNPKPKVNQKSVETELFIRTYYYCWMIKLKPLSEPEGV